MSSIENMSLCSWDACLGNTFRIVSNTLACKPILRDIGRIRLQLLVVDRPEMSYWEEYCEEYVTPHIGQCANPTVQVATTFSVLLATLLNQVSVMESAADEAYEVRGDTVALMKCANILPYVMAAFARVMAGPLPEIVDEPT